MSSLMNTIREFNTLSTIKEIFGDTEFTKKQYDYIRHVTGNQLMSLDAIRGAWFGDYFNTRKEALYGNGLDEKVYIMTLKPSPYCNREMVVAKSIPVKEIESLPKKVRKYIKENMVEENKYPTATHNSGYRNFFSVNEEKMNDRIDTLKNMIKAYISDAEIESLENQLRALQNKIATMLKIREEIED